jgi:hypothetical protein
MSEPLVRVVEPMASRRVATVRVPVHGPHDHGNDAERLTMALEQLIEEWTDPIRAGINPCSLDDVAVAVSRIHAKFGAP